jgi:hypothetical protein
MPPLALDHVFVLCEVGAHGAQALRDIGLREGSRNVHPGQGTANRRFFFRNCFLELLWVDDAAEAQREPAAGTRLWERWSQRNGTASPFGLLLRPEGEAAVALPFPTWSYRPSYLPPGASLEFACGVPLGEPALVVMNWPRGPGAAGAEPVDHPAGLGELLHVCVGVPAVDALSDAAQVVRDACGIAYRSTGAPLLQLDFAADRDVEHDLRPALPLLLCGVARPRVTPEIP